MNEINYLFCEDDVDFDEFSFFKIIFALLNLVTCCLF